MAIKKISKEALELFTCYTELEPHEDLSLEDQLEMYYKINLIREFDTKVTYMAWPIHMSGQKQSPLGPARRSKAKTGSPRLIVVTGM